MHAAAVLGLLLALFGPAAGQAAYCTGRQTCSVDAPGMRPFIGDIHSGASSALTCPCKHASESKGFSSHAHPTDDGLEKALQSRSFKKEVIILMGSSGLMLPLLQTIRDFESWG